jgi:hypothetical protein
MCARTETSGKRGSGQAPSVCRRVGVEESDGATGGARSLGKPSGHAVKERQRED